MNGKWTFDSKAKAVVGEITRNFLQEQEAKSGGKYNNFVEFVKNVTRAIRSCKAIADVNCDSDFKILVLYHSDLDGNGSAFGIARFINAVANDYFNDDAYIKFRRINYNYNLHAKKASSGKSIMDDIEECNILFIVDYSLRPDNPHMKEIYDAMQKKNTHKSYNGNIVWIDHHDSSTKVPDLSELKKIRREFLDASNHFIKAEVKGLSATLLCYMAYMVYTYHDVDKPNRDNNTLDLLYEDMVAYMPDLIGYISLYDTFHPDADTSFYYGISTVSYDIESKCISDEWIDVNDSKRLYGEVLFSFDNNLFVHDTTSPLYKLLQKGDIIREYAENSNNIYRMNTLMRINLIFKGKEYSIVAINAKGNSFIFGDEYYNHDGVMMFYFNHTGTYTYSLFADNADTTKTNLIPCNLIAEEFGGGGHKGAAGFTIPFNILERYMVRKPESEVGDYDYIIYIDRVIKEMHN